MVPPTKPVGQENKSWKKINEERKAFKRERRQERLIRQVENAEKLKKLAKLKENEITIEKPDPSTVSIAVPGSILENAQSPELRSYLAGQIARAAVIFRVNEIIIFDDIGIATAKNTKVIYDDETNAAEGGEGITRAVRASSLQLARILQYLECPQYLRKFFFPLHKDLKYSGIMNPLETPHHLRQQTVFLYREGVVTEKQAKEGRCFVNVGLLNDVLVNKDIKPGVRVTVKLNNIKESKKLRGTVVSPDEPRRETGVYWGYTVRIAHSLAEIFSKSPYRGGYDCSIGTSDRGSNVQEVEKSSCAYKHLLIVFGGLAGLETALANDEKLSVEDPALLFDYYLNVLPKQGSRTIRTEEAVLIAMSALQEKLKPTVPDIDDKAYQDLLPQSEDTGIKAVYEQKPRRQHGDHKTTASDNEAPEIVHMNPFINGVGRVKKGVIHEPAAEDVRKVAHSLFRKPGHSPLPRTERKSKRGFKNDAEGAEKEVQGERNNFKPKNPFIRSESKESNERHDRSFSTDQLPDGEDSNDKKPSFKLSNPFVEKKRKFSEQQIYMEGTERNSSKKLFVKLNSESFQNLIAREGSDDLEVVPTTGKATPSKHKKIKRDIDLSRFD